jgi:ribosomal protein S25
MVGRSLKLGTTSEIPILDKEMQKRRAKEVGSLRIITYV